MIKAKVYKMGKSDSYYCNLRIKINAGGGLDKSERISYYNIVEVFDSSGKYNPYKTDSSFRSKFKEAHKKLSDSIDLMRCFYILDYKTSTNIRVNKNKSDSSWASGTNTISYIQAPRWEKEKGISSFSGSGFIAFVGNKEGRGGGELKFNTNLLNEASNMCSRWDITQSNYEIAFDCIDIGCDTISIEFFGATNFSNMFPLPQKTTMSSVEFTDSIAINEIMKNGLRFHAEFIEMKEMSAKRTFILTAILSLIISIFANLLYKRLYEKKSIM